MKKLFFVAMLFSITIGGVHAQKKSNNPNDNHGYPIEPVHFTSVKVTDSFWGQRLKASRTVTIPLAFSKCEETGRYENFIKAANPSEDYKVDGFSFDDTDVYKTIEGAGYLLQTYPDKQLEKYIDSVLVIIAAAQEPDGYLYTSRTMNPKHPHEWAGSKRWEKVEDLSHEFYNLGHMVEGAIAHYQATGKRNFLDIAIRYADCVCREVGDKPGQTVAVPGHQIAEMALAKLYLVTGNKKYLNQAKFFLDKRGYTGRKGEYSQAHKPVVEQNEAVGHAVRAAYMYAGMADVAALTSDESYINAINNIWGNIVGKKLYITGGIGATNHGEAFGANYKLPNMSAYCETCAAIGNVYLNYRLFLLHGESKYYDVLERTLYNGLISGVSLDGNSFFYPNPLESTGQHQRQPWFGCACCPSNIARFIPSLPGYVYAVKDKNVYVNLFMSNTSDLKVNERNLSLRQTTNYPWDGTVMIDVTKATGQAFTMNIRIPGWARNQVVPSDLYTYTDGKRPSYFVKVNGREVQNELKNGYLCIDRKWKKGDQVEICFDMEVRTVKANEKVEADRGRVSVERGPIVYCAEWPDNDFDVLSVFMNRKPEFKVVSKPDILYGINQITTDAQTLSYDNRGGLTTTDVKLTLIPYYAWAHRGSGRMAVWLANELSASRPTMSPTLASGSKMNAQELDSLYRKADTFSQRYHSKYYNYIHAIEALDSAQCFWYATHTPAGEAFYIIDPVNKIVTPTKKDPRKKSGGGNYWGGIFKENAKVHVSSPDGTKTAYISEGNLWITNLKTKENRQLSFDGSPYEYYSSNIYWSSDSKKIVCCKYHPVDNRKLLLISSSPKEQLQPITEEYDYPKPGDALPVRRPVAFLLEEGKAIRFDVPEVEQQFVLDNIKWSKDSRYFTFNFNKRGHQRYTIYSGDIESGLLRTIVNEDSNTFIHYGGLYQYWFKESSELLWLSERDGWKHLYLYDTTTGTIKKQLTQGQWIVKSVVHVDETQRKVIFVGCGMQKQEDPYLEKYYSLNIDNGKITPLTPEDANHKITFSKDHKYMVDSYSRVDLVPTIVVRSVNDGKVIFKPENQPDISLALKEGYRIPEVFSAKGRDGKTDIWGMIMRPDNFDPSQKYPVIEYIYAGPHDSHVPKNFAIDHWGFSLTDLGFIVVIIDGMGTANRSKAFHDVCWRNLKDAGFPDRIAWIKTAAQKYTEMDIERVGIFGSSAGGQNAMGAVLFHPEFYKVSVAACGCHDNRMDKIWWNEQWMGYPVGKEYDECSNVTNAHLLQGKLMLILGELDNNVDPSSTLQVVNALIKHKKEFEFVMLPGERHTMGGSYGERKRRDFFVKYLLNREPPEWNK
ncbi:Non-reducing end beta-L-arabinofuranosidase [termite gut metagenome]|uniref:Non-reducing end beta-L-arabinofuranosidase n=1 Tax=termite gut metagenome TaxID=433724 RepID=A0A5J4RMW2_9ZZZZ